jgi:hypothetical protein
MLCFDSCSDMLCLHPDQTNSQQVSSISGKLCSLSDVIADQSAHSTPIHCSAQRALSEPFLFLISHLVTDISCFATTQSRVINFLPHHQRFSSGVVFWIPSLISAIASASVMASAIASAIAIFPFPVPDTIPPHLIPLRRVRRCVSRISVGVW